MARRPAGLAATAGRQAMAALLDRVACILAVLVRLSGCGCYRVHSCSATMLVEPLQPQHAQQMDEIL